MGLIRANSISPLFRSPDAGPSGPAPQPIKRSVGKPTSEELDAYKAQLESEGLSSTETERQVFRYANEPDPARRSSYMRRETRPLDLSVGGTGGPKEFAQAIVPSIRQAFSNTPIAQKIPGLRLNERERLFGVEEHPEGLAGVVGTVTGRVLPGLIGASEVPLTGAPEESFLAVPPTAFVGIEGRALAQALGTLPRAREVFGVGRLLPERSLVPQVAGAAAPFEAADNIIGLPPIQPGLSKTDEIANVVRGMFGQAKDDPIATPAMRVRTLGKQKGESVSNVFSSQAQARARKVFTLDTEGRIESLANVDQSITGAPTIADVAARLPRYEQALLPEQRAFMDWLKQNMSQWRNLMEGQGAEIHTRADIVDGGFYLPRGSANPAEVDEPVRIITGRRGMGGKKGFERAARFESQAKGIEEGYKYPGFGEALSRFGKDASDKSVDAFVANYFKATGLGETASQRVSPELRAEVESLRNQIQTRRTALIKQGATIKVLGEQEARAVSRASGSPKVISKTEQAVKAFEAEDLDTALEELRQAERLFNSRLRELGGVGPEAFARKRLEQTGQEFDAIRNRLDTLRPIWQSELRKSRETPRGMGEIDLSNLRGTAFPLEVANAANKVLSAEKPPHVVIGAFNNLWRGVRATFDLSAAGIQGLMGAADSPSNYGRALGLMYQSIADDTAAGRMLESVSNTAKAEGRLTAMEWAAKANLRIAGEATEFRVGLEGVGNLPGFKQANRAFGNFGDGLRLRWADDMLADELRTGRSLDDIIKSGDLGRIAEITNNMTGWSKGKAGGNLGDLLLFAPRYFQSRLEVVAKAGLGLRPGATLDQRIARRSMLKMIGEGVLLTVALNKLLDNETDFEPIKDGKWNPNFLRVRVGEGDNARDWSVFGPWDSLARAFTVTAQGKPQEALRGMASGILSTSWDLISGQDFIGQDVRNNPLDFAQWALRSSLPFSLQQAPTLAANLAGAINKADIQGAIATSVTILGEVHGVKTAPLSFRDIRDIASQSRFDKPYDDLNKGERDIVNAQPEVAERIGQFKQDVGSEQQQTSHSLELWKDTKTRLETDLAKKIQAGRIGESLKDAIQSFKEQRFILGETLFNEVVSRVLTRKDAPVEDILADRYWTVPAPEDARTGAIDFDKQDLERERILQEAAGLGVPLSYITGTGAGTYRGKRFENKQVNVAVQEYEQDQALIKASKYWDAYKEMPLLLKYPAIQNYYREFHVIGDSAFKLKYGDYTLSLVKTISDDLADIREEKRVANPELDAALVKWYGYRPKTALGARWRVYMDRQLAGAAK